LLENKKSENKRKEKNKTINLHALFQMQLLCLSGGWGECSTLAVAIFVGHMFEMTFYLNDD
jgi:hypothetical protein